MNLVHKIKETALSVLPIVCIVILLHFTIAPLPTTTLWQFLISAIYVILGLAIFLLGTDVGVSPLGEKIGSGLANKKNIPLLISCAFVIGFLITIAEPDVQIFANQITSVFPVINGNFLLCMIACGIGFFVTLGLIRSFTSIKLKYILLFFYVVIFVIAFSTPQEYIAVAFDSGGATTGPMTVPFIIALGIGAASVQTKGHGGTNNSFGLTGIASMGPIMAVLLMGFFSKNATTVEEVTQVAEETSLNLDSLSIFIESIPHVLWEVFLALLPLIILFVVFQIFLLKMTPRQLAKMTFGIFYCFLGLFLFLTGVRYGFMPAGEILGGAISQSTLPYLIIPVGVIFGAIVVFSEPAVWVLTEQIEDVSEGTIKKNVLLFTLAIGVAIAIGLSLTRVIFGFSIWYLILPGYALALILMFFCPPIFTAIAFDSGGVASGPMTSTFILSFTIGAATAFGGNPITDAFGVIAMVAMMPLIVIQILGILFNLKKKKAEVSHE